MTRHVCIWGMLAAGLLTLLVGSGRANANRPRLTMTVAPQEVALGETVTLTVEIDLPGLSGPDRYWHPDTALFKVVDSQIKRGTQTTMDAQQGQRLRSVEVYRYVLLPQNTGRLRIGPAKIRVGQDEWETPQASVKVLAKGGIGMSTDGIGDTDADGLDAPGYVPPTGPRQDVFLYAVADKNSVWAGEQLTVSWLLFTRTEVLKYEPTPPALTGLWSETLFEPSAFFKYSDVRLGVDDYVVALVSKRAIFATSPGTLVVPPLEAKIATMSTAVGRSDAIFSNAIEVEIRPLPAPMPPGFDASYVGKYELMAAVDRDLLPAGQPLTLSLRVQGQGAIRRTTAPRLRFPGFLFELPRDHETKDMRQGDTVAGERLYRYWTTPTESGDLVIPAIELTYFDVESGSYQVARTQPIGITVEGTMDDVADAERNASAALAVNRDIRLAHNTRHVQSRVLVDSYRQPWFWWLLCAPFGVYLLVVGGDRLRRRRKKETPRARLRRARGKARARYRLAEIHLKGLRPAKFYAELSHAIYEHMEEWLAESMQPLTRAEMKSYMLSRGLEAGMVARVLSVLEAFDQARFASSKIGAEEMKRDLERTKELLSRVERNKGGLVEDRP
jgi:hypothetical protein